MRKNRIDKARLKAIAAWRAKVPSLSTLQELADQAQELHMGYDPVPLDPSRADELGYGAPHKPHITPMLVPSPENLVLIGFASEHVIKMLCKPGVDGRLMMVARRFHEGEVPIYIEQVASKQE